LLKLPKFPAYHENRAEAASHAIAANALPQVIMHNQYVNDIRRTMREQATVDVEQVASTLVATTDPTASRHLSELDRALGYLSKGQREVVLLVGLEGMSYDALGTCA
jgi:DNA-directed RNA polymerase specialized sigma24 family protein